MTFMVDEPGWYIYLQKKTTKSAEALERSRHA
jgi:hypothetical protein